MRQHCFLLFFLGLFVFVSPAQEKMEYVAFMNNVLSNHPLIQRARNFSQIGAASLSAARGNYDPQISGVYSNKYYDTKNYYSVLNSEIKQAIFTNQSIKAGYEFGQGSHVNPENLTSSYGLGYIGIEAALLQGLVIDKRRADVLKAEQYKVINESEQKQLMNDILHASAEIYTDWLFTQNVVKINKYFTTLSTVRLEGIKQLAAIGERPAIDTTEATMLVQQRILDYQAAVVENQKLIAAIAVNNWKNAKAEEFNINLISIDSLRGLMNVMAAKIAGELNELSHNNPIVTQYQSKVKLLEVEKRYRAEMVKPILNVNYNFLTAPSNAGLDAQLSMNNYKWGASLAFPLFLRNSRADLSMAKLNLKSSGYELEMKDNEINTKISMVINSIKILAEQVKTAEKSVIYSKLMLEGEKLKFENGESSVFLINTRETKWLESEIKLNEYEDKYIKAIFELIYLKGNMNYFN